MVFAQVTGHSLLPTRWWEQVGALTAEPRIIAGQRHMALLPTLWCHFGESGWQARLSTGMEGGERMGSGSEDVPVVSNTGSAGRVDGSVRADRLGL